MVFTNKSDRISKFSLTGLSNHNMTLSVRKLTKKRLQYFGGCISDSVKTVIPKSITTQFEQELRNVSWDEIIECHDLDMCCDSVTTALETLTVKYSKNIKCKQQRATPPWLNNEICTLMKKRDLALKTSLSSKLNTDVLLYKSLRNKVVQELRKAKSLYNTQLIGNVNGHCASLWKHN